VFSLVVSMVIPRRRPEFPGRRVGLFAFVAVLLVAAMLTAVEIFGVEEEEGEAHDGGAATEVAGTGDSDAEGPTGTDGGADQGGGGDAAAGRDVFASDCANCHTLAAADATGTIGPNLDESNVTVEEAAEQVENGGGAMPPFGDQLSQEQIQAVAAFVVESRGG